VRAPLLSAALQARSAARAQGTTSIRGGAASQPKSAAQPTTTTATEPVAKPARLAAVRSRGEKTYVVRQTKHARMILRATTALCVSTRLLLPQSPIETGSGSGGGGGTAIAEAAPDRLTPLDLTINNQHTYQWRCGAAMRCSDAEAATFTRACTHSSGVSGYRWLSRSRDSLLSKTALALCVFNGNVYTLASTLGETGHAYVHVVVELDL
jgi:hypothetical protein